MPSVGADLMPQMLGIVCQLLLILTFADEDFLHMTGQCFADLLADLLVTTCHATLMEWGEMTTWATFGIELFLGTDLLIQLITIIQLL